MKALTLGIILALCLVLSGCGSSCTPHAGYWQPASTDPAHYTYDQQFSYFSYPRTCYNSGYYSHGYYHTSYHCYTSVVSHYITVPVYHEAVYHPRIYIPEETCGKARTT